MKWSVRWFTGCVRWPIYLFFKIFYGLQVTGSENIPDEGGVLLAANHASFYDPPLLQMASRRLVVYTPRTSLSNSLLYRCLTRFAAVVPIERASADLSATRQVRQLLKDENVVALFPEQTRTHTGRMAGLKAGFHVLAARAKVRVVPMFIEGTYEAWPRHRRWPRWRGKIRLHVGPALSLKGLPREESVARLEAALQALGAQKETAALPDEGGADQGRSQSANA